MKNSKTLWFISISIGDVYISGNFIKTITKYERFVSKDKISMATTLNHSSNCDCFHLHMPSLRSIQTLKNEEKTQTTSFRITIQRFCIITIELFVLTLFYDNLISEVDNELRKMLFLNNWQHKTHFLHCSLHSDIPDWSISNQGCQWHHVTMQRTMKKVGLVSNGHF